MTLVGGWRAYSARAAAAHFRRRAQRADQASGVRVLTKTMVTSADANSIHTKEGEFINADLMVWAAGIKAPDLSKEIGGLETNRINQLVVEPTLQTTRDADIYAIGDCASCAPPEGGFVPPRAQAARTDGDLRPAQYSGADER
ncbi:FAD-dependent oxidoreductase [Escherichia coli]